MFWASNFISIDKMDDIQANEKRSSSPEQQSDEGTGKVIPLDSEVEQFYGSSTTQAYRLKSELVGKCMEEIGMGKSVPWLSLSGKNSHLQMQVPMEALRGNWIRLDSRQRKYPNDLSTLILTLPVCIPRNRKCPTSHRARILRYQQGQL